MTRLIAFALCTLAIGCVAEPEMPTKAEGQALFDANCVMCHGATGKGDGKAAGMMWPQPSDLTRIAARAGGSFDRARVLTMIDGYSRADVAGVDMPEFGELLKGDTVPVDVGDGVLTPTPRPLAALLVWLEAAQE